MFDVDCFRLRGAGALLMFVLFVSDQLLPEILNQEDRVKSNFIS